MRHISSIIIIIISIISLQSCFSEVESTPKISYEDNSDHNNSNKSIISHISNQPFENWEIGKKFYVTNNKISQALLSKNSNDSLCDSYITYIGHRIKTSITESKTTELLFLSEKSDTLYYHINSTIEDLNKRNHLEIPFTIQKSLIDEVSLFLTGKQLYIITPFWYNDNGESVIGRKFIPISIEKVCAGNAIYPIKLFFNENGNRYFVYMTIGNNFHNTRNFDTLFSVTNPHDKYPLISNEIWNVISNNSIKLGMTQEECFLSIGAPDNVISDMSQSSPIKIWEYKNGTSLIFENGILTQLKN